MEAEDVPKVRSFRNRRVATLPVDLVGWCSPAEARDGDRSWDLGVVHRRAVWSCRRDEAGTPGDHLWGVVDEEHTPGDHPWDVVDRADIPDGRQWVEVAWPHNWVAPPKNHSMASPLAVYISPGTHSCNRFRSPIQRWVSAGCGAWA